jgi:hypothetical protein
LYHLIISENATLQNNLCCLLNEYIRVVVRKRVKDEQFGY